MKGILAIETATDACSVALWRDGLVDERHELIPRQHSQRLFGMLREILPDGGLDSAGIDAIAYGCGPGSFTGLRVAASAVQGLCFAAQIPAISVSTLACQVQTAIAEGLVAEGEAVVSLIDARINEVYGATYRVEGGLAVEIAPPRACPPALFEARVVEAVVAIGSGLRLADDFSESFRAQLARQADDLLPRARDLIPLALLAADAGKLQTAAEVQPVYVRDEIHWKKISEQGKQK